MIAACITMASLLIVAGAVLGGVGLCAGTLANQRIAKACTSPIHARNWETAVRSWLMHSLAILVAGSLALMPQANDARGMLIGAGTLFLTGTVLFSGCLAAVIVSGRTIFAAVAPLGGIMLLIGWAVLAAAGLSIH